MSPAALFRLFTVVLALSIVVVVWRRRPQPGAAPFALMMLAAGAWAFFALLEHTAVDVAAKVRYAALEYPGIMAVAPLWLVFALDYAGHADRLRRRHLVALAVMPVLTVALVWTNGLHHLIWPSITPSSPEPGAPLVYGHGAWFWLAAASNYALLVAGTATLVAAVARAPARYRAQTAALLAGMALPWIGNALYLVNARLLGGIDPTPLAFALTGAVYAVGVFNRQLFDLVPVARHALIEGMADGVLVLDAPGRVIDVNPSARALLGLAAAPIGKPAARVLARWPVLAALAADGAERAVDLRTDSEHGARDLSARLSDVRDARGRLQGRLLVVTDVTERKRTEEALRQSEKLASLGQLLAGVAHELNNPLSVVIGHATLLRREVSSTGAAGRVEKIAAAADRCASIVADFLAVARHRLPERTAVDLDQVLRGAVAVLTPHLAPDGITVTLDLAGSLPTVHADPHQLHQVFVNLLVNAQHALREQQRPRRIMVRSRHHAGRARVALSIIDTGPGIPSALRPRIFEPFFTTKPVGMGSGLGLAVCRGIVEAHNGLIEIEDGPDGGTVAYVELPVTSPEGAPERRAPGEAAEVARGKRILVVDDEPLVASLLVDLLTGDGHRVEVAGNGREALDRLGAADFDVIISDFKMPVLDGPTLYQRQVLRDARARDRFVFITGDALAPETRRFIAQTGVRTLDKPFLPAQVRRVVQQVLRQA